VQHELSELPAGIEKDVHVGPAVVEQFLVHVKGPVLVLLVPTIELGTSIRGHVVWIIEACIWEGVEIHLAGVEGVQFVWKETFLDFRQTKAVRQCSQGHGQKVD